MKIIKHFEKVKPFRYVQLAKNSVKEDATSGKVRAKRKVVRRLERLPGKLPEAGWEGGGSRACHGLGVFRIFLRSATYFYQASLEEKWSTKRW